LALHLAQSWTQFSKPDAFSSPSKVKTGYSRLDQGYATSGPKVARRKVQILNRV